MTRLLLASWCSNVHMHFLSSPHTVTVFLDGANWQAIKNREFCAQSMQAVCSPSIPRACFPNYSFIQMLFLFALCFSLACTSFYLILLAPLPPHPHFKCASYLHVFKHTVTFRHSVLSQVCFACGLVNKTEWLGSLAYQSINSFANQIG